MPRLSETYKHLYFPIDWGKANSRAVAYLLNMNHDLLVSKLHEHGFTGELIEIKHTRLSGNTFTVVARILTKREWVLALLLFKNNYRLRILKQLQAGKSLEQVDIEWRG